MIFCAHSQAQRRRRGLQPELGQHLLFVISTNRGTPTNDGLSFDFPLNRLPNAEWAGGWLDQPFRHLCSKQRFPFDVPLSRLPNAQNKTQPHVRWQSNAPVQLGVAAPALQEPGEPLHLGRVCQLNCMFNQTAWLPIWQNGLLSWFPFIYRGLT